MSPFLCFLKKLTVHWYILGTHSDHIYQREFVPAHEIPSFSLLHHFYAFKAHTYIVLTAGECASTSWQCLSLRRLMGCWGIFFRFLSCVVYSHNV